jgi:glycosyltransferase involved in cell wall biosynthesis
LRVLYCGIDLLPFRATVDPVAVRAGLGIPADALVVGHVDRFREVKNHTFLVDIAVELAKREPRMRLLLIGDGPLRPAIERQAKKGGVGEKIFFAGVRSDISRLMLGAMDVFVLPSLHEGLPIVGIEAQAAGLPFILSDVVSEETDVVDSLVRRLSLSQPASAWAEEIVAMKRFPPPVAQQNAVRLSNLEATYAGQIIRFA